MNRGNILTSSVELFAVALSLMGQDALLVLLHDLLPESVLDLHVLPHAEAVTSCVGAVEWSAEDDVGVALGADCLIGGNYVGERRGVPVLGDLMDVIQISPVC